MRVILASLGLGLIATSAAAAPFCVVTNYGNECYYYDAPSCERAAAQRRSVCVVDRSQTGGALGQGNKSGGLFGNNPLESGAFGGQSGGAGSIIGKGLGGSGAPFCVVTSYGEQCQYYDAPSCQRAAQQARGGCVVNPDR
jgi:hypothetical protein